MTLIQAGRDDIGDCKGIRFVQSGSKDDEVVDTVRAIKEYVFSKKYTVRDRESTRNVGFGDIAVICRKTEHCRMIRDACEAEGIPAYLQGDVQIMSTREGKLALAWLRYVNNERDPWAFVPIMADMDYTPVQIKSAVANPKLLPQILVDQREELYKKRRRITDLLTSLFQFYSLDNDVTQAIISTMSSVHRGSLLTISDVIRIIENDIENRSTYPVENLIDTKAVTIMTMHKSKGLEFPVVITPFIDAGVMPSTNRDSGTFFFDDTLGVRCSKEIGRFGDYSKICINWRTRLAKSVLSMDYSEERRLMFVALSRAKQYETIICGPKPSKFIEELMDGEFATIPDVEYDPDVLREQLIEKPAVPVYPARRQKIGVHEILNFNDEDGTSNSLGSDEVGGKGMEYGTEIHKIAELLEKGKPVDESYPEVEQIRKVLTSVSDADIRYTEIECGLPIDDLNVTLRGVIDLLVLYPDRIEVHDYKTDVSDRFESEYIMQLSIYAHAVQGFYNKPVDCYIDYVSRGIFKRIEPLDMSLVKKRVLDCFSELNK